MLEQAKERPAWSSSCTEDIHSTIIVPVCRFRLHSTLEAVTASSGTILRDAAQRKSAAITETQVQV